MFLDIVRVIRAQDLVMDLKQQLNAHCPMARQQPVILHVQMIHHVTRFPHPGVWQTGRGVLGIPGTSAKAGRAVWENLVSQRSIAVLPIVMTCVQPMRHVVIIL